MEIPELVPLDADAKRRDAVRTRRQSSYAVASRLWYKPTLRALRLLTLLILLPTLCICIPVYLRYKVFLGQMYPMGMTDMRLIDSKISTTWCQRQVVKSNTTFNAFVVPQSPELSNELVQVSMTRHLELEDDMKEYWGFYLLEGSTVTVSTCVRWPGASLVMIKGYKHLQECAYIGDDSSEEIDELLKARELGLLSDKLYLQKISELKKEDGPANDPDAMKRHKGGVKFHDPYHEVNETSALPLSTVDVTDHDPKEIKEILERLHSIRQAAKEEALKKYHPPSHLMSLPALHRHRDTNVDRDERRWISFQDLDAKSVEKDNTTNEPETVVYRNTEINTEIPLQLKIETHTLTTNNHQNETKDNVSTTTAKDINIENKEENQNSREIYEDVLKRLQSLGERGHRVLQKLHDTMSLKSNNTDVNNGTEFNNDNTDLEHLSQVIIEAIDEERKRPERKQMRHDARMSANKAKREITLGQTTFEKELNEDDEARNYAAEEDLQPDGYAEHHERVNETTAFDMSNSEFWSSFSSSEEALLECDGLILNLPLTPHGSCRADSSEDERLKAARRNALTYKVPANGYYFFVFNSENEVQTNFINVRFDLQKTIYDVARTALRTCRNSTARCDLNLDLFSSQKVVLELPLRDNESLWNEQFVVISECEPRTSIYMACVIAVPILIMVFGFQ